MSSYLLLRDNKESGPFTIEQIKAMSLKAYDLIWVVGKSAAWRYPGEIADFKTFAPPVPEQLTDLFIKRTETKKTEPNGLAQESGPQKKPETVNQQRWENNSQRTMTSRSIYVNLPSEKKPLVKSRDRVQFEADFPVALHPEPAYDFSDLYKKHSSSSARISVKVLWVSTIALLFGAGILTGLFISDRRKFFSVAEKPTQQQPLNLPATNHGLKENEPQIKLAGQSASGYERTGLRRDSAKSLKSTTVKMGGLAIKKTPGSGSENTDSMKSQSALLNTLKLNDSVKQSGIPKIDPLYQKIKTHPENYIDLVTGRYNTGVFGGISSFPVTLTNNAPVALDLVVVNINYIQSNEKIFKTESLSFSDLQPGETVTLKAPKSTRGVRVNTRIQLVYSRQLDTGTSN